MLTLPPFFWAGPVPRRAAWVTTFWCDERVDLAVLMEVAHRVSLPTSARSPEHHGLSKGSEASRCQGGSLDTLPQRRHGGEDSRFAAHQPKQHKNTLLLRTREEVDGGGWESLQFLSLHVSILLRRYGYCRYPRSVYEETGILDFIVDAKEPYTG